MKAKPIRLQRYKTLKRQNHKEIKQQEKNTSPQDLRIKHEIHGTKKGF